MIHYKDSNESVKQRFSHVQCYTLSHMEFTPCDPHGVNSMGDKVHVIVLTQNQILHSCIESRV